MVVEIDPQRTSEVVGDWPKAAIGADAVIDPRHEFYLLYLVEPLTLNFRIVPANKPEVAGDRLRQPESPSAARKPSAVRWGEGNGRNAPNICNRRSFDTPSVSALNFVVYSIAVALSPASA
jgi:hypothetical protein